MEVRRRPEKGLARMSVSPKLIQPPASMRDLDQKSGLTPRRNGMLGEMHLEYARNSFSSVDVGTLRRTVWNLTRAPLV